MRYLGNKSRIAKEIAPFLVEHLTGENWYIEPFVGACGMMQGVNYPKRIGRDEDGYIIALMRHIQTGGSFDPSIVTEDLYRRVKNKGIIYLTPSRKSAIF